jgi:hypothetical protein
MHTPAGLSRRPSALQRAKIRSALELSCHWRKSRQISGTTGSSTATFIDLTSPPVLCAAKILTLCCFWPSGMQRGQTGDARITVIQYGKANGACKVCAACRCLMDLETKEGCQATGLSLDDLQGERENMLDRSGNSLTVLHARLESKTLFSSHSVITCSA